MSSSARSLFHLDPELLRQTVQLEVNRRERKDDMEIVRQYAKESHPIYELPHSQRAASFEELELRYFRTLGFQEQLEKSLLHYPLLAKLKRIELAVTHAPKNEGADLIVPQGNPDQLFVRLSVRPQRFLQPYFDYFLNAEWMHIADMLDPAFAYQPSRAWRSATPAGQKAAQERFSLLWSMSVEARLRNLGIDTGSARQEFEHRLSYCYPRRTAETLSTLAETIRREAHPTQEWLLSFAEDEAGTPHCPLCGFPTSAWADPADLDRVAARVRTDSPEWRRENGACERCVEGYLAQEIH
ncbi:MAG TPA: hypothetical protein VI895_01320 [Bdellovibrionota bacterium]|nr:hypothetical protein [Bdellovibrionota bacterium]